ncbi:hypothetical protein HAPAU_41100 [Halalkalicoccus paucihalophilus]|uniref:Uncharacterized protein n=1 Tax=Halalkalicoccus paucihalophilus TaxID=1008153 RepID=A0A151A8M9_9EURY|nr:hypothetical protein HAPAU_41100 [Halalkalicoccus paucihalophilus]
MSTTEYASDALVSADWVEDHLEENTAWVTRIR